MCSALNEVYVVSAIRTPVGKAPRGMLKDVRPDDLLIHTLKSCLAKAPMLDPAAINDVVVGCAFPEGEQGMNMARTALLLAGLPESVGGITVNRYCASSLSAISIAANAIATGQAEVMIAAGAESMSMVPMMGNKPAFNNEVFAKKENYGIAYGMGLTAEKVASKWNVSRQAQDEFALNSHLKAINAQNSNSFEDEISPFEFVQQRPNLQSGDIDQLQLKMTKDEGPRGDSTIESLSKLRPVFSSKGSVTAGNSSQMSDGSAALLLASEKAVKQYCLQPIAKWHGCAVRGVSPELMGIGPVEAIPAVCQLAGLTIGDLDWIELNEAFSAQAIAVIDTLKLNPECINPLGGAIALGHPLGATGAIRATTVIHGLRKRGLKYGMVTMCVGAGMGAAGIFESL